jgi:hypothetical protein
MDENQNVQTPAADEPKVFDGEYVKKLREEAARYRTERNSLKEQAEKMAAEQAEREKKAAEEQGNFKKLYEDANKKLETLTAYEERIKGIETVFNAELESIKKAMNPKQIELLEKLPPQMTIEQKLSWARELAAPANNTQIETPRPGGGSQPVEPLAEEFKKASLQRRAEILNAAKVQNPKLYDLLTKI